MQEKQRDKWLKIGTINGWPQQIDYTTLPERILQLEEEVLEMIQDPDVLKNSLVWKNFLSNIDAKIFNFSNARSKFTFIYALYGRRCG